jgi:hypothetical protein
VEAAAASSTLIVGKERSGTRSSVIGHDDYHPTHSLRLMRHRAKGISTRRCVSEGDVVRLARFRKQDTEVKPVGQDEFGRLSGRGSSGVEHHALGLPTHHDETHDVARRNGDLGRVERVLIRPLEEPYEVDFPAVPRAGDPVVDLRGRIRVPASRERRRLSVAGAQEERAEEQNERR